MRGLAPTFGLIHILFDFWLLCGGTKVIRMILETSRIIRMGEECVDKKLSISSD